MLTFAAIIGFTAATLSILTKIIGSPDQIKKNYSRKSTEGLSTKYMVIAFFTHSLWTLHAILQKDWYLFWGQGLGAITVGIIVYQIYIYRKN